VTREPEPICGVSLKEERAPLPFSLLCPSYSSFSSYSSLLLLPPLAPSCSSLLLPWPPQHCPELAEVHVAGSSITDASLESLAAHCPSLHTLSVSMCRKVSGLLPL